MADNEIRIAIAEACGWEKRPARSFQGWEWHKDGLFLRDHELPDYPNDLNAMHEAEKVLNNPKHMQKHSFNNYANTLIEMCKHQCNAIHATARQRAEALLRTLN